MSLPQSEQENMKSRKSSTNTLIKANTLKDNKLDTATRDIKTNVRK